MPIINGENFNQRQLLWSAKIIGRLTLIKHYNHWLANGVPHPDWINDWTAKGYPQVGELIPRQHFFGPDGKWHDGYMWDAVPEDPNDRPPDIGTNPAPTYPWGQENTKKYPPITIETIMGWEYLQDLAELWTGINLATNATFPQVTNWPIDPKDHPAPSSYKGDDIGVTFSDLNIKNPISPVAKFNATVGNNLIKYNPVYESKSRSSTGFGPTRGTWGSFNFSFDHHFRAWTSFGFSETRWEGSVNNHWDKSFARENQALFPYCHTTVNPNHWYRQKYRDDNVFVFFASIPQPFDSFVIKDNSGTIPYSVCSIPDFLDYEISGTRRLYKDAQYIPKEVKVSAKIQFNSVILYADNNGTPVLIAASKVDPPIISEGKGKSIFYSKYYFAGKSVTPIDIVEI